MHCSFPYLTTCLERIYCVITKQVSANVLRWLPDRSSSWWHSTHSTLAWCSLHWSWSTLWLSTWAHSHSHASSVRHAHCTLSPLLVHTRILLRVRTSPVATSIARTSILWWTACSSHRRSSSSTLISASIHSFQPKLLL